MLNDEIRTIMTCDPVVVGPNQTLNELADLMKKERLQQLPVVENGELLGMITTHDLWKESQNRTNPSDVLVKDVMSTTVIKVAPKDKLGTAAELFLDQRFKTIPVVNLDNQLKGVVTAFDVIKCVMRKEYPTAILYEDVINS